VSEEFVSGRPRAQVSFRPGYRRKFIELAFLSNSRDPSLAVYIATKLEIFIDRLISTGVLKPITSEDIDKDLNMGVTQQISEFKQTKSQH
jgi:hypothetical protein